jgi:hypothetical protein
LVFFKFSFRTFFGFIFIFYSEHFFEKYLVF